MGGTTVSTAGAVPAETPKKTLREQRDSLLAGLTHALDMVIEAAEKSGRTPASVGGWLSIKPEGPAEENFSFMSRVELDLANGGDVTVQEHASGGSPTA